MSRARVPVLPRSLRLAAATGVALALLVASVADPPAAGPPDAVLGVPTDKWSHALGYAPLASALAYARLQRGGRLSRCTLAVVFLVVTIYGAGVEGLQAAVPTRTVDPIDALANAVGAAVGTLPWLAVRGESERP